VVAVMMKAVPHNIAVALENAARTHGVPVALLRAVAWVESRFNPRAVSPKGAQGLMQLMPATAKALGVGDPWDPQENAFGAAKYLAQLLNSYAGDVRQALAAYNFGPHNLQTKGMPAQVQRYVDRVQQAAKEGVQPGEADPFLQSSQPPVCSMCGRKLAGECEA